MTFGTILVLTMPGPINVKSPNNTSKWQMGFNSAFKGLISPSIRRRNLTEVNIKNSQFCILIFSRTYASLFTRDEHRLYTGPLYIDPLYTGPLYTGPLYTVSLYTGPLYTRPLYTGPLYRIQAHYIHAHY
jgi:hypothetical protein